jgi:hypothetical protein
MNYVAPLSVYCLIKVNSYQIVKNQCNQNRNIKFTKLPRNEGTDGMSVTDSPARERDWKLFNTMRILCIVILHMDATLLNGRRITTGRIADSEWLSSGDVPQRVCE